MTIVLWSVDMQAGLWRESPQPFDVAGLIGRIIAHQDATPPAIQRLGAPIVAVMAASRWAALVADAPSTCAGHTALGERGAPSHAARMGGPGP